MSGLLSEVLNAESQSQRLNLWDAFRVNCGGVFLMPIGGRRS